MKNKIIILILILIMGISLHARNIISEERFSIKKIDNNRNLSKYWAGYLCINNILVLYFDSDRSGHSINVRNKNGYLIECKLEYKNGGFYKDYYSIKLLREIKEIKE